MSRMDQFTLNFFRTAERDFGMRSALQIKVEVDDSLFEIAFRIAINSVDPQNTVIKEMFHRHRTKVIVVMKGQLGRCNAIDYSVQGIRKISLIDVEVHGKIFWCIWSETIANLSANFLIIHSSR